MRGVGVLEHLIGDILLFDDGMGMGMEVFFYCYKKAM